MTARCINCRQPKPVFKTVDGGRVSGTAGTRLRPPVFWCKECWEENVRFNAESRKRDEAKLAAQLAKMGIEL